MKDVIQLKKKNKNRFQLFKTILAIVFAAFILSFSYVNDQLFLKELAIAIAIISIVMVLKGRDRKTDFSKVVNLYEQEENLDKRKIN
ncbi:hypothetical protein ACOCEA_06195 [Maribacter sp. CXY002]|uniref:hypothetical protein n=1 Tax=Maribacter luteocoastalis TaxID=3407671 RepID=UPI003B67F4E5